MGLNVGSINSNRPSAKVYPPISKVARVSRGATPVEEVDAPMRSALPESVALSGAPQAEGDISASVLFEGKGSEVDVYV